MERLFQRVLHHEEKSPVIKVSECVCSEANEKKEKDSRMRSAFAPDWVTGEISIVISDLLSHTRSRHRLDQEDAMIRRGAQFDNETGENERLTNLCLILSACVFAIRVAAMTASNTSCS